MKIKEGKEKEYREWFDKNSDPYIIECFLYAERWAELIEEKITSDEESLSAIVEWAHVLSYVADIRNLTGFMYGCAVSILSDYWQYGEELRKWHNKEYGYEGDGVVNPVMVYLNQ